MKAQIFLPVTLVAFVGLMGVMKMRRNEQEKETKQFRLLDIKLRITGDIMDEFRSELAEMENQVKTEQGDQEAMEAQVAELQEKAEKTKGGEGECRGGQKLIADQLAAVEATLNEVKSTSTKEENEWKAETDVLRKNLAERSSVCDFLKEQTDSTRKFCDSKDVGKEQNAEAPKQEEPPKQEEAKADAPKQEEAKAEAPK